MTVVARADRLARADHHHGRLRHRLLENLARPRPGDCPGPPATPLRLPGRRDGEGDAESNDQLTKHDAISEHLTEWENGSAHTHHVPAQQARGTAARQDGETPD